MPRSSPVSSATGGRATRRRAGIGLVQLDWLAPVRDGSECVEETGLAPLVVDDADVGPSLDGRRRSQAAAEDGPAHGADREPEQTPARHQGSTEPCHGSGRFGVLVVGNGRRRRPNGRPSRHACLRCANRPPAEPGVSDEAFAVEPHVGDPECTHDIARHGVIPEVVEVPEVGDDARHRGHAGARQQADTGQEVEVADDSAHARSPLGGNRDHPSRAVAVPLRRFYPPLQILDALERRSPRGRAIAHAYWRHTEAGIGRFVW